MRGKRYTVANFNSDPIYSGARAAILKTGKCNHSDDTPIFVNAPFALVQPLVISPGNGTVMVKAVCLGRSETAHFDEIFGNIPVLTMDAISIIMNNMPDNQIDKHRRDVCNHIGNLGVSSIIREYGKNIREIGKGNSTVYLHYLVRCFRCNSTIDVALPRGSMKRNLHEILARK